MKVENLIKELRKFDDNMDVIVADFKRLSLSDVDSISINNNAIQLNVNVFNVGNYVEIGLHTININGMKVKRVVYRNRLHDNLYIAKYNHEYIDVFCSVDDHGVTNFYSQEQIHEEEIVIH